MAGSPSTPAASASAARLRTRRRFRAVLLTHSHIDHVCSLPIFAMNVADCGGPGVRVYAPVPVIETLKQDLFNGRLWPDFTLLKRDGLPLLTFEPIELRRVVHD